MSTTYLLYLEGRVDGKWTCLDGYYKHIPRGKTEPVYSLSCLYVSGSRSYFHETYDKLREIGTMTPFTELSEEVCLEHPNLEHFDLFDRDSTAIADYLTIPVSVFNDTVPSSFEHHGVFHKDRIAAFENGDTEELWEDEDVKLSELTELELQCYAYKEWDDPFSWPYYFKILKDRIKAVVDQYTIDTWYYDALDMRIVLFSL